MLLRKEKFLNDMLSNDSRVSGKILLSINAVIVLITKKKSERICIRDSAAVLNNKEVSY